LAWLAANAAPAHASVVTSLPDRSEIAGASFDAWQTWFHRAVRAILAWLPEGGVAIFYQTDVRHDEVWVDKGQLVMSAAEAESMSLVWHKIVCRRPAGTANPEGRPSYSHLVCLAREARAPRRPSPDVLLAAGPPDATRAMGFAVCQLVCDYLRHETATRCVVDPCCGTGSVLAVASALGFDVIGVELNAKRCRAARTMIAKVTALHQAVVAGARAFDRGAFFEAHEVWEDHWRIAEDEAERRGVQGLIQAAAAFHKLFEMRGPESAARLLGRALAKLDATAWLPGFELARFRSELHACACALEAGTLARSDVPRLLHPRGEA